MTEVGRAMALASIKDGQLVAFFIFRTEQECRFGSIEEELRHAYKGAGWHVGRVLARIPVRRQHA